MSEAYLEGMKTTYTRIGSPQIGHLSEAYLEGMKTFHPLGYLCSPHVVRSLPRRNENMRRNTQTAAKTGGSEAYLEGMKTEAWRQTPGGLIESPKPTSKEWKPILTENGMIASNPSEAYLEGMKTACTASNAAARFPVRSLPRRNEN